MLSLSLKVVWLVFALLGVPLTWFALIPFASAIGTYWASVLYCLTVTVLEVTFALGMIWRMTPSEMPHWFCVVQAVVIALCFHIMTGICGCFTWASYLTVFKPYRSIQASASALLWRRAYYLFVVVFPLLAFSAYLVAVLKTDSVHPVTDLHCDNSSPLWPRLLGYAGAPIVLYTPCFILSIAIALRIRWTQAKFREMLSQEARQYESTRAANADSCMVTPQRLAAPPISGVSDKLPPQSLDGHTGMTIDLRLHGSSTRSSSPVSLPIEPGSVGSLSSSTHSPIELPAVSPLGIPAAYLSRHSPPTSAECAGSPDIERGRTPSPIIFARALPSSQNLTQPDASGEPCNGLCASSDYESGTVFPPHSVVHEEPPTPPLSPSRAAISLDVGERMPKFHLPTRSPPNGLRPSLELSPEYVRARLEEDRAILARCLENLPASPCSSHRHLRSPSLTRKSPDYIGSLPSITYTDRALEGLPEVDEAEKGSPVTDEEDLADARKVVCMDSPEPPLKPVRQFYRSAPRPSIGRPPGLHPAIRRMVAFQLIFFFILVLASLSTLIDLVKDRDTPTSFGTQHIAIILAAWCPAVVFGYPPGVRNNPFFPRHCRA